MGETGELGEFRLVDQDNREFAKPSLKGSIWVLDFFYTSCKAACPRMNREMKRLQQDFAGDNVRFLSISVDPDRDTPRVLARYAGELGAHPGKWYFVTGPSEVVQRLQREAANEEDPEEPTHSRRFFLADSDGYLRGFYNPLRRDDLEALKRDLRRLLKNPRRPV